MLQMLFELCLLLLIPTTYLFVGTDAPRICYLGVKDGYSRWQQLNAVVATQKTGRLNIALTSMGMILTTLYISLIQYLNTTVTRISKDEYEVRYVIGGRLYAMRVKPHRGRPWVTKITDSEGNDVTKEIRPYMGPQYDWHGNTFASHDFGHSELTFTLQHGSVHTEQGTIEVSKLNMTKTTQEPDKT